MNRKAQVTPLVMFFVDLVFIVVWIFFLADLLTLAGNSMITAGAGGFEAFFYANLNLWIFECLIMFNSVVFGGG